MLNILYHCKSRRLSLNIQNIKFTKTLEPKFYAFSRISKATAQWWFSSGEMSLYLKASSVRALIWNRRNFHWFLQCTEKLETGAISPGMHCCSRCDLDRDRRLRLAWWGGQYCPSCFWDLLAISVHTSDKQMDTDISGQDFSCWASWRNPKSF